MTRSLKPLIRVHEWTLDQKRQQLGEALGVLDSLYGRKRHIEEQIVYERQCAGPDTDLMVQSAFAPYAQRAQRQRQQVIEQIRAQQREVNRMREELRLAFLELKTYTVTQKRRDAEALAEQNRRETATLDEIGQNAHQRRKATAG